MAIDGADHVLSSTQKSDVTSLPDHPFSKAPSTIRSEDFHPLIPDGSQSTLLTENNNLPTNHGQEYNPLYTNHRQEYRQKSINQEQTEREKAVEFNPYVQEKSPVSYYNIFVLLFGMYLIDFVKFQEQVLNEPRNFTEAQKIKLDEQKQNLLQEQERLRQILADQELLLLKKQQQLRQQHIIQQQRLQQYQLTGKFPQLINDDIVQADKLLKDQDVRMYQPANVGGLHYKL